MTDEVVAQTVVAWLKRAEGPPRVSLLGIFFAPARWLGHYMHGGAYVPGDLRLMPDELRFEPDKIRARLNRQFLSWSVPLSDISDVTRKSGLAMDTIDIHHAGGVETLKTIKGRDMGFFAQLDAARQGAAATA